MVNTDRFEYDVEAIYLAWSWLKKFTGSELRINTLGRSDARKRYREELYKFLLVNKQRLKPENQLRLDINVMRVLDQLSPEEELIGEMPDIYDFLDEEDKTYFDNTLALLKELSIDFIRDPSLVRGLDYYEQTVFEFIVQGQAIAGGGRYLFDRRRFGESALGIPGVGWGIGLDRLPLDNLSTQELEVHIIHINNYSYANEIISIINQSGGICIPIYGDFSSCFKIASKKNAKSIISYSEIDRNERCINYKTKSGSKRIKIQELADCVRG
jgi:histidyl-tRNA synthetase